MCTCVSQKCHKNAEQQRSIFHLFLHRLLCSFPPNSVLHVCLFLETKLEYHYWPSLPFQPLFQSRCRGSCFCVLYSFQDFQTIFNGFVTVSSARLLSVWVLFLHSCWVCARECFESSPKAASPSSDGWSSCHHRFMPVLFSQQVRLHVRLPGAWWAISHHWHGVKLTSLTTCCRVWLTSTPRRSPGQTARKQHKAAIHVFSHFVFVFRSQLLDFEAASRWVSCFRLSVNPSCLVWAEGREQALMWPWVCFWPDEEVERFHTLKSMLVWMRANHLQLTWNILYRSEMFKEFQLRFNCLGLFGTLAAWPCH